MNCRRTTTDRLTKLNHSNELQVNYQTANKQRQDELTESFELLEPLIRFLRATEDQQLHKLTTRTNQTNGLTMKLVA